MVHIKHFYRHDITWSNQLFSLLHSRDSKASLLFPQIQTIITLTTDSMVRWTPSTWYQYQQPCGKWTIFWVSHFRQMHSNLPIHSGQDVHGTKGNIAHDSPTFNYTLDPRIPCLRSPRPTSRAFSGSLLKLCPPIDNAHCYTHSMVWMMDKGQMMKRV